jgi:membrane-bound lytic murein transglycosylase MltF
MKSRKLLVFYVSLLVVAAVAMIMLRPSAPREIPPRDYAGVRREGVLRVIAVDKPSESSVAIFTYELSRAVATISGLEIEVRPETNTADSFAALARNECDAVAQDTLPQSWTVRNNAPELADSLDAWFDRLRNDGLLDKIYKRYHIILKET